MAKPLSPKDWAKNAGLREELRQILESPALQQALETIKDSYLPSLTRTLIPQQDVTYMERLALDAVARGAFYTFPTALAALANAEEPKPIENLQPWHGLLKEGDPKPAKLKRRTTTPK